MIILSIASSIIVTIFVGYLLTKKYKPQPVLFLAGMILMTCASCFGIGTIFPVKESTGLFFLDIFEFIKKTFSSRTAVVGLNIMVVGGFARYMDHIGASKALVSLVIKPMQKLNAPYVVMCATWIIGMFLGLFINSASSLAMILMVTVYPILISLGISRLSACAVISTTLCMDWSPGDTASILSATTAGVDVATYWINYQVPISLVVMLTVTILHYFVQKWFDKCHGHLPVKSTEVAHFHQNKETIPPGIYALLPAIPLFLILVCSDLGINWIKMDIAKAMFISIFITTVFEYIRHRDGKKVFNDLQIFFDAFGNQMASVVTLLVAGETFAKGLQIIGTIDIIINSSQNYGFGVIGMILVIVSIIAVSAVVMGSGTAPFFAFFSLAPTVAAQIGVDPVLLLIPMQFTASITRSISPISSAIVVTADMGGVSAFDLAKRTVIPMLGAMIVMLVATFTLIDH